MVSDAQKEAIMARVEFKENSPIQSLSGTLGDLVFRTRNGKTSVFQRYEPELPEQASRAERRRFKREQIVRDCVSILQNEMRDMVAAIEQRTKIRNRILYLYKKYEKEIKAPTKLQRKMMSEYRAKWCQRGNCLENGSMQPR